MRDSVLAAAELLQAQVEDVLARLLTWYEANKAAWDARRGAVGAGEEGARRGRVAVRGDWSDTAARWARSRADRRQGRSEAPAERRSW